MYDIIMVDIWYSVFYKAHETVKWNMWIIVIQFYKYYLGGQKITSKSTDCDTPPPKKTTPHCIANIFSISQKSLGKNCWAT